MEVFKDGDARLGVDSMDAPGEIVSALLHAAGFVRHRLGEFLEGYELTEGRYAVLSALEHAGAKGLSQSELAEQMLQSESNVSSLIDRLHRDGLVDRRWSDTDRRKRVLLLTADGSQLVRHVEGARRRWAESLLADLAPHDRRSLAQGLKHLPGQAELHVPESISGEIAELPTDADGVPHWPDHSVIANRDPNSPHFALERMLSTLGLAGRFAEDEQ